MTNWPEKTDTCAGTCVKFGAPDLRRFSRLFNNQNVNNSCFSCTTVCIQEDNIFEFQSGSCGVSALYFQACGSTNNYRIVTSALAANRTAKLPVLAGNDVFVFNCATATLTNKTVDLASNVLKDTGASAGDLLLYNGVCSKFESKGVRQTFMHRFGDETTTISIGNGQLEWQMPYCFTLTDVFATVKTASSSGLPSIQIQQNALDILSTAITIDVGEKTSRTAVTVPVISDTTLDVNGVITFDLDAVGTGVTGLIIYMIGYHRI
jgi:hypothetical protein